MKANLILVSLLFSIPTYSEVPHTFAASTPARASEVNENFSALDQSIGAVNTSLSAIDERLIDLENSSNCINKTAYNHVTPTYNYLAAANGDVILIDGRNYKIIDIPVHTFDTRNKYSVRFPAIMDAGGNFYLDVKVINKASLPNMCNPIDIDGYSSEIVGNNVREYFGADDMAYLGIGSTAEIKGNILVEDAVISISYSEAEGPETVLYYPQGTTDFVTAMGSFDDGQRQNLPATFDQLIDYIKIERVY